MSYSSLCVVCGKAVNFCATDSPSYGFPMGRVALHFVCPTEESKPADPPSTTPASTVCPQCGCPAPFHYEGCALGGY